MYDYQKKYFSFYSSFTRNFTTDPSQMLIPIDDHGFHRGDGVFEAMKWKADKIWLLDKHLDRLFVSAKLLGITSPLAKEEIKKIIHQLVVLANRKEGMVRVFLTRGPGNFGVSPKDTIGAQIYIVTTELKAVSPAIVNEGVKIGVSQIPVKQGIFSQAKTLNYLPNVLMKKECEDRGLDYVISLTAEKYLAESYTENIFFIHKKSLIYPKFDYILKGTSLVRFIELLQSTEVGKKHIHSIHEKNISFEEALSFESLFSIGTTIDIQWAQTLEDKKYTKPYYFEELKALLINDQ